MAAGVAINSLGINFYSRPRSSPIHHRFASRLLFVLFFGFLHYRPL